jgi:hypothetical protein
VCDVGESDVSVDNDGMPGRIFIKETSVAFDDGMTPIIEYAVTGLVVILVEKSDVQGKFPRASD